MLLLVKNATVYAPEPRGVQDILTGGGKILALAPRIDPAQLPGEVEVLDGDGLAAAPGFIDAHVHIIGGGGEGGYATRTPELAVSSCFAAGVTTVVGTLGTDGVARSMEALLAKTYALREEGLSAFCYTGSYRVPPRTITGDAMKDIMFIEPIIGVGETAISDHRSSAPTVQELARLATEARLGGMLSGKAGIVNFHIGDAKAALTPLEELVRPGEIPRSQFLPTHCNRSAAVFAAALAWARAGGYIDFTTSTVPGFREHDELSAACALRRALEAGIPLERLSCTSDGQGSLPRFDENGAFAGLGIGTSASLLQTFREAILGEGLAFDVALRPFTSSPAAMLKLRGKGGLAVGADADIILIDPRDCRLETVIAGGRLAMHGGDVRMKGRFEA